VRLCYHARVPYPPPDPRPDERYHNRERIDYVCRWVNHQGAFLNIGNLSRRGKLHKRLVARLPDMVMYGIDVVSPTEAGVEVKDFPRQSIGSVEQMPFTDGMFDYLYMGEVLEHVWRPKQAIDECYRVLKPGGILIFDVPHVYALSRIIRHTLTGRDIILGDPDHKIFYSKAMIDNLLATCGFSVLALHADRLVTLKRMHFTLPPFINHLGETLIAVARK